jgi:hypothetical protein
MPATTTIFEKGTVTSAICVGDEVVKQTYDPLGSAQAEQVCQELETYHAALQVGPLAVAELRRIGVVTKPDGYHAQQVSQFVEGQPVSLLPFDERRIAIGALAETVQQMPSLPGSATKLLTPIDARPRNFIKRASDGKTVIVDELPSWLWDRDALVKTALVPAMPTLQRIENTGVHGTRGGVMTELVMSVVPEPEPDEPAVARLKRVIAAGERWYEDLIPAAFPEIAREDLAVRVEMRLGGYLNAALRAAAGLAPR